MPYRSVFIMFLLALSTVAGVSVALLGREGWRAAVFWYAAQLLPLFYILLAWAGSQTKDVGDSMSHSDND